MAIKIESQVERKLPADTLKNIESAFDSLPREHTRGLERIRLVEFISEPRLRGAFQATELPGLYHPRQGPKGAWLELAMGVLLPANKPAHKKDRSAAVVQRKPGRDSVLTGRPALSFHSKAFA